MFGLLAIFASIRYPPIYLDLEFGASMAAGKANGFAFHCHRNGTQWVATSNLPGKFPEETEGFEPI